MKKITFNPDLITKKLLNSLDERPKSILSIRFGLSSDGPKTLEFIGNKYGITRERVRQIEAFALNKIRKSEEFEKLEHVFNEIKSYVDQQSCLVSEEDLLTSFTTNDNLKRHLRFILVTGEPFRLLQENEDFCRAWTTDIKKAENIRKVMQSFHKGMGNNLLLSEKEAFALFKKYLTKVLEEKTDEDMISSLLGVSKLFKPNALGEWGRASSPFINPRGMRDYAFLVMRRHGSPMHFSETAGAIKKLFGKPAHIQTVHNELIKDKRFVLVGRGLYALKEWGYEGGVVRNVIEKVLSSGPLPKDEIIKRVLKERHVKENTILVNLQNRNYFKKDSQGSYTLLC